MKQYEQVIEAMKRNDGFATLGRLNQIVDVSKWNTKTPFATIRRIVQEYNQYFFRIKPGLWALKQYEHEILKKFRITDKNKIDDDAGFNHSYYQGLLLEIGNLQGFSTYVPPQDKNKLFLDKPLGHISKIDKIYEFTFDELIRRVKTIDVIWFNERRMPNSLFEVEHTTDIEHSLNKFVDLQDFYTRFFIVSAVERKREYEQKIGYAAFAGIRRRVEFIDYDFVSNYHSKSFELATIGKL